jgi:HPr kinase/phosphorylase
MSEGTGFSEGQVVTVAELCAADVVGLQFEILQQEGKEKEIRSPRIQKLGLALAGYPGYIHPDRVQIIGGSELKYLEILDAPRRRDAVLHLQGLEICCIVVTKGLELPPELLGLAAAERIPVLRTRAMSSISIDRLGDFLERRLSPRITIHGVLLDVLGLGVLLLGPSGIGKSECALELLLKGYRLVADDFVEITRRGTDRVVGTGGQSFRYHMELRGLGIIDVKELFGISATGQARAIDLAIRLERWKPDAEYDRLGIEQRSIDFLGVQVPLVAMPVGPGRNVSALVEVAARLQLLRQRGYQPSQEFLKTFGPTPNK